MIVDYGRRSTSDYAQEALQCVHRPPNSNSKFAVHGSNARILIPHMQAEGECVADGKTCEDPSTVRVSVVAFNKLCL